MLKGYITTAFLIAFIRSSFSFDNECNYICDADGCKTFKNNSDTNISSIKFCSNEDISSDVNFSIIENKHETSELPAILQINLKPPKNTCKYVLTLLANVSINEKKCVNYRFHNSYGSETHTRSTICFVSNEKQHQNITGIFIPYIFTACYSVQFYFGKDAKMIKDNKFLKTNYKRTEVIKPTFECTYEYNIVPDSINNKKLVHFEMYLSVPIVTAGLLNLGMLYSSDGQEICSINNEYFPNGVWSFNVLDNYIGGKFHNFNTTLLTNGTYRKDLKFQTEVLQDANYCVLMSLYDDIRCKEYTLWKPPVSACVWYQSCQNITTYNLGIPANINSDTASYLYLPIIIVTLVIFVIIGVMYLIYIIHICKTQGKNFYINICSGNIIKTNQSKYDKSNMYTLKENKKKVKCKNASVTNKDIILLYPRGPESFMALMTDFREILSRVCGYVVHDWYSGAEWNYVAEIGAFDWFAEMLHKESRVVWIDTPTMRSLITQTFHKNSSQNIEQSIAKIGDFRDVVFPTIFNLSKRNIEQSMLHQPRHFIVRLKGFDNFELNNDPFVDLSPHMRYFIPQDLNLLCSDLSSESNIIVPLTSQEDFIKQHLHYIKFEFCK